MLVCECERERESERERERERERESEKQWGSCQGYQDTKAEGKEIMKTRMRNTKLENYSSYVYYFKMSILEITSTYWR